MDRYVENWDEQNFNAVSAKYLKIEGVKCLYGSGQDPQNRIEIKEIMLLDSVYGPASLEKDMSSKISTVNLYNAIYTYAPENLKDNNWNNYSYIEGWSDSDPGYYIITLSEEAEINKIVMGLLKDSYGQQFKFKIYGSMDNADWGTPLVDQSSEWVQDMVYYVFDPVTIKYLKIEGMYNYITTRDVIRNSIIPTEVKIFANGRPGPLAIDYNVDDMREWAKRIGFRSDAELIRFAKTALMTDAPEVTAYIYATDASGVIYKSTETSLSKGITTRFFDGKGRLIEEIAGEVTDNNVSPVNRGSGHLSDYETMPVLHCDGNDYLFLDAHDDFDLGGLNGGDFTLDFYVKFSSSANSAVLLSTFGTTHLGWELYYYNGVLSVWSGESTGRGNSWSASPNEWYHMALVRSGSTITQYVNGESIGIVSDGNFNNDGKRLEIGNRSYSNEILLNGYMRNVRITKDEALWTSDFDSPTGAEDYTVTANTKLLFMFDEEIGTSAWTDSTGRHTIQGVGDPAQVGTLVPVGAEYEDTYNADGSYIRIYYKSGQPSYFMEYNADGDIIAEKDILALVWEENSDVRQYFLTPGSTGTGTYSGWTLKKWASEVGYLTDERLVSYRRDVNVYSAELAAVLDANQALKDQFTNPDSTINETAAVQWARSEGKTMYAVLFIYDTSLDTLSDAYRADYVYQKASDGTLISVSKTVDLKQTTYTTYDTSGQVLTDRTRSLNVTRKLHTYDYYDNGRVEKDTIARNGYKTSTIEMLYNTDGEITQYKEGSTTYDYEYTRDEWNNIEKVKAGTDTTIFLTDEETLEYTEAEIRIIEYFRAMLYRDPTPEELAVFTANWENTGYTSYARDMISRTDEYTNGANLDFEEQAESARDIRISDIRATLNNLKAALTGIIDGIAVNITDIVQDLAGAGSVYEARKHENDKKYIIEIYRQELGREATDAEVTASLDYLTGEGITLDEFRVYLRDESNPNSEYNLRRAEISAIIDALYDTVSGSGMLADYMNAADKVEYVATYLGYNINPEYLVDITADQVAAVIAWLRSQDNHFARSAVEALYKQLELAGVQNIPSLSDIVKQLIFIDIITGVINENTQGMLLISMHAIKKVSGRYELDMYGTAYDIDEFLSKFDTIPGFSAIVHYNNSHFLNVTGVIKDGSGNITHVQVTNGYIDGIEQTKTIEIGKFKQSYEGKILSTERSDYDKRLVDKQLMNIRGAGWWSKLWKAVTKWFQGVVKAVKKVINYIIEPIKQLINAIKYAVSEGKWGRVFGAIGALVVGTVMSFIAPAYAHTIMSTVVSMATAICYGEYALALKSLAIGIATFAFQAVLKVTNVFQSALTFVGDVVGHVITGVTTVVSGVSSFIGNAINYVTDLAVKGYQFIVEKAKALGDAMRRAFNRTGEVITGLFGGLVSNGISRYIGEEIDKTSNWLAKLGIGFMGAMFLMPATAFANPDFGIMKDGTSWLTPEKFGIHAASELIFDSMNQVISQEAYKALEDTLGEEWYGDLLRNSVNTVISAGFDVMKQATHQAILKEQTIQRYKNMVERYGESGDKNVKLRVNPETGNEIVYTTETVNGKERIIAYADERFQMEADYANNKVNINGKDFDINEGLIVHYSEDFISEDLGYSVRLQATFNLESGELSNEELVYNDAHLAIHEENGLKYAKSTDGRTFRVNSDNTITDITDVNLYVDYDKKVAFIEGEKVSFVTNEDGTISISSGNSIISVSGDDKHTLLSHIVTTEGGDVFELKISSSGIIDYDNSTINGQIGQLTATQLENGSYQLNMTADGQLYSTETTLMNTYTLVDDEKMYNFLGRGDATLIMPESAAEQSIWGQIGDAINSKLNNISDAHYFYDSTDSHSSLNTYSLLFNNMNKNMASVARGMGWETLANFIRPDITNRTSTYINFYYEAYGDYALLYEATDGYGYVKGALAKDKIELCNLLIVGDVKNHVQYKFNVQYEEFMGYKSAGGYSFTNSAGYDILNPTHIVSPAMNDYRTFYYDRATTQLWINSHKLNQDINIGGGLSLSLEGRGTIVIILKKYGQIYWDILQRLRGL